MIDRLQGMIDKLQQALPEMELIPELAQEKLAAQIEELLEQLEYQKKGQGGTSTKAKKSTKSTKKEWKNPVGSWADMPDTVDEMFDALDKIRHANPPSSPIELP